VFCWKLAYSGWQYYTIPVPTHTTILLLLLLFFLFLLLQVITFLFATFENYVVLSNTLWHLGMNPQVQLALRNQTTTLLGHNKLPTTTEEVQKVSVARSIIKESLRVTQVGVNTWRVTRDSHRVGGHVLPPGTSIIVPMAAIHHNPKVWKYPTRFLPSRFEEDGKVGGGGGGKGDATQRSNTLSFIPFGFGMRMCLGYR